MKWIFIAIVLFLLILFFTTLNIKIKYKRREENDHIHIQVSAWFGLITLKYNIPLLQIQSLFKGVPVDQKMAPAGNEKATVQKSRFRLTPRDVQRYLHKIYRMRIQIHDFNVIAKKTLKHIRCDQWEWYTRVGVGDAAATGVVTGMIWGIKTTLVGFFSHYISLRTTPRMNVVPAFQEDHIDTQFGCILRFRIGHAIIAGTRLLFNLRKGREGTWQNTQFRA